MALQSTYPGVALRTYWMVARFGKRLLPRYKAQLRTTTNGILFMDAIFALVAIGLGNRSLRAEVRKTLRGPSGPSAAWTTPFVDRLVGSRGAFDGVLDDPQRYIDFPTTNGNKVLHKTVHEKQPQLAALAERWPTVDDVPDELGRTGALYNGFDPLASQRDSDALLEALPLIVPLAPAQLFWPEEVCEVTRGQWNVGVGMGLLKRLHGQFWRAQAARAEAKVGRNAPCPCGSGKKHKRCCLA